MTTAATDFSNWLWPLLTLLFALIWLVTLARSRSKRSRVRFAAAHVQLERVAAEDLLKTAYVRAGLKSFWDVEAIAQRAGFPEGLAAHGAAALVSLGWADEEPDGRMRLTDEGAARAQQLIRAHRLWERYLVEREGMALEDVHAEAHRREHATTPEELEQLDADLEHPAWDPHGHAIPAPSGRLPLTPGHVLSEDGEDGRRLRVVCVDDEPPDLLAQLVALGLRPGAEVTVVEEDPDCLWVQAEWSVVPVARAAARHVSVVPAPAVPIELGAMPPGTQANVVELRGAGRHQRRMLDMGFVPGATVGVVRVAPLGDPVEYEIKGTSVALRRREANTILVEEVNGE